MVDSIVDRPPRATSHLMRDSFVLMLALLQHIAVPPELEDDHQQNALCHRGTACHARLLNRPLFSFSTVLALQQLECLQSLSEATPLALPAPWLPLSAVSGRSGQLQGIPPPR